MASLGALFCCSVAAEKPSPSRPSFSPSSSHQKPLTALYAPHSRAASTCFLRLKDKSHRRAAVGAKRKPSSAARRAKFLAVTKPDPLKVMISGAPASGKGTQCDLIKNKYGLVHISVGDLLRAEVAAGTQNGKRAREFMEKGLLVPDEIVVTMVKERLQQPDSESNGWLLDGYPRSLSQAMALQDLGIQADIFILLYVSDDNLIERVVGRRLDPVTGRIYHLKYSPPENEEIAARLTQRFDDTEEKAKLRLQTHHQNVESVLSMYEAITFKVNGDAPKEVVFAEIDKALSSILEMKLNTDSSSIAAAVAP